MYYLHANITLIEVDNVDELLYRYKYSDDKVKKFFEKYITAYYFYKTIEGDHQEKLYYIAKCYLKGRHEVRREYFNKYRKKSIGDDIKKTSYHFF